MLKRLQVLGYCGKFSPFLPADVRCLRRIASKAPTEGSATSGAADAHVVFTRWMLWLMDLRPAALRSVCRRLAFTRKEQESILAAAELYQGAKRWAKWRPSRLTLKLDGIPEAAIEAVRVALPQGNPQQLLDRYLHSWRHLRAHTTGSDLRARGLKPGPRYRSILTALRAAWIDGAIHDAHGERLVLEKLLRRAAPRARGVSAARAARDPR